MQMLLRALAYG